jgi:hypothetical protein
LELGHDRSAIGLRRSCPAKKAIIDLVKTTTDKASPNFVAPENRIATFDQDGTTWVEHPIYTQLMYCLERVPAVVKEKPALKNVEPFKTERVYGIPPEQIVGTAGGVKYGYDKSGKPFLTKEP